MLNVRTEPASKMMVMAAKMNCMEVDDIYIYIYRKGLND
jgi:hypothetical protein